MRAGDAVKFNLVQLLGLAVQQAGTAGGKRAYEVLSAALIPPLVVAARGAGWSIEDLQERITTAWRAEDEKT